MRSSPEVVRWVGRWWRGETGAAGAALSAALWPAEQLYGAVVHARNHAFDAGWLPRDEAPIDTISVGNLAVGGAGKTPVAAFVAQLLRERGRQPATVLRGYGMDELQVHRELNPAIPVFHAVRRVEAVRQAAAAGCDVAVLDDAFQHRRLRRDLDVVLVGADAWRGRPRLLPRGPWRERLDALARADLLVVTRKTAAPERAAELERLLATHARAIPTVRCHLAATGLTPLHGRRAERRPVGSLAGERVLAVTSLADPAPLVRHLQNSGAEVELAAYPDHHRFVPQDAQHILQRARGRPLVMTLKEAVKLRGLIEAAVPALVVRQEVCVERGAGALDRALGRLSGAPGGAGIG